MGIFKLSKIFVRSKSLVSNFKKGQIRSFASSGGSGFPPFKDYHEPGSVKRLEFVVQYLADAFQKKGEQEHWEVFDRHGRDFQRMGVHHIRVPSTPRADKVRDEGSITEEEITKFEEALISEGLTDANLKVLAEVFPNFISSSGDEKTVYRAALRNMLWAWKNHGEATELKMVAYFILAKQLFDATVKNDPLLGLAVNKWIRIKNFKSKYFQSVSLHICRKFGGKKKSLFIEGVIGIVQAEVEWNVVNGVTRPFEDVEFNGGKCGPYFWLLE